MALSDKRDAAMLLYIVTTHNAKATVSAYHAADEGTEFAKALKCMREYEFLLDVLVKGLLRARGCWHCCETMAAQKGPASTRMHRQL